MVRESDLTIKVYLTFVPLCDASAQTCDHDSGNHRLYHMINDTIISCAQAAIIEVK